MIAKFIRLNLQDSIDRKLDSNHVQVYFFAEFPIQSKLGLTCKALCFALSIKGKTLATF